MEVQDEEKNLTFFMTLYLSLLCIPSKTREMVDKETLFKIFFLPHVLVAVWEFPK